MNLAALRDRVRSLTGIRLDTLRSDENIDEVINEAYQEIVNLHNWPFLRSEATVTVAAGVEEFDTPNGFSNVSSVSYASEVNSQTRMKQTTLDEIDLLDQDDEGDPYFYARIDESSFRIWPKPVDSITFVVRGKAVVNNLSSDSDVPVFDEQFRPGIAYRAASKILAEEGDDSGRSDSYQREANIMFARMQQYYLSVSDTGLIVMGSQRRRRTIDAYRRNSFR